MDGSGPATLAVALRCPHCAQPALISHSIRSGYPVPWLRWAHTLTHTFACTACGAEPRMIEVTGRRAGANDSRRRNWPA